PIDEAGVILAAGVSRAQQAAVGIEDHRAGPLALRTAEVLVHSVQAIDGVHVYNTCIRRATIGCGAIEITGRIANDPNAREATDLTESPAGAVKSPKHRLVARRIELEKNSP